jgi:hypothetical protein
MSFEELDQKLWCKQLELNDLIESLDPQIHDFTSKLYKENGVDKYKDEIEKIRDELTKVCNHYSRLNKNNIIGDKIYYYSCQKCNYTSDIIYPDNFNNSETELDKLAYKLFVNEKNSNLLKKKINRNLHNKDFIEEEKLLLDQYKLIDNEIHKIPCNLHTKYIFYEGCPFCDM